jgi:hypothetical protein
VNLKSFEKYGQIFLSSYNDGSGEPSFYKFRIDGVIYRLPSE